MKIRGIAVLAVLVSTLLSACATSGPKFNEMAASMSPAKPDMGRIYFYRTALIGAAVQPEVRLNGEKVGKAVPNGFFYVDRPAGNYQVVTETEVEKKLTFTLDAGQVRYVRLDISMGFWVGHVYGELIDEDKAQSEIAGTRYIGAATTPWRSSRSATCVLGRPSISSRRTPGAHPIWRLGWRMRSGIGTRTFGFNMLPD